MKHWVDEHAAKILGIVLALTLGLLIYALVHASSQRRSFCQDVEALKTIRRNELKEQISNSRIYLRQHPHGAPGIPRALILDSIKDNRKVVEQLAAKSC